MTMMYMMFLGVACRMRHADRAWLEKILSLRNRPHLNRLEASQERHVFPLWLLILQNDLMAER